HLWPLKRRSHASRRGRRRPPAPFAPVARVAPPGMTGPAPAAIPVARHAPPGMKGAAPAAIPVAPAQKGPPVAKLAPAGAKGPVAPQAVEPTHHEDVVKHFAGHVDRANLSSEKKAAHKQTAAQVLRQMTPRALRRIVRHSQGGIHYHNDLASLRDGLAA